MRIVGVEMFGLVPQKLRSGSVWNFPKYKRESTHQFNEKENIADLQHSTKKCGQFDRVLIAEFSTQKKLFEAMLRSLQFVISGLEKMSKHGISYVLMLIAFLTLQVASQHQNTHYFRTKVLAEDRARQAKLNESLGTHPPVRMRTNMRLQQLVDMRTKQVCVKEVLTSTLVTERGQFLKGNGSSPHLSVITTCCEGFVENRNSPGTCVPDCSGKCINGECVAPNVCHCFPNYVPNLSHECVNTCPLGCINGECRSNGTCICRKGYRLETKGKFCIPICEGGCGPAQNCTAPGRCECYDGYALAKSGQCVPVCRNDCLHGSCVSPGVCVCDPGYQMKDGACQANCSQNCLNGRCIAPDRCLCNEGYYFDPARELCVPRCKHCHDGTCVAPEVCKCFDGYKNTEDRSSCLPHCEGGCHGGLCYAPGKCDCSFYAINAFAHCRSTGKCYVFVGGLCVWWHDY